MSTAVYVPGPVAAATFRDGGARIIKVEPPDGDPLSVAAPDWYAELCAELEIDMDDGEALTRTFKQRSADEWRHWALARALPLAVVK